MTPVSLEPAAPRSRVKHSTTEPLCSLVDLLISVFYIFITFCIRETPKRVQTVKAKMKCKLNANCFSLGSLLRVKIKRSSEKKNTLYFYFSFWKITTWHPRYVQWTIPSSLYQTRSIQRIKFRLVPLQVLNVHDDQRKCGYVAVWAACQRWFTMRFMNMIIMLD